MAGKKGSTGKESAPKPRSDAYVGLLTISFLAQIAGAVFLFLDYSQYEGNKDPIAIARDLKSKATGGVAGGPAPPPVPGPGPEKKGPPEPEKKGPPPIPPGKGP
jgi:hypothetical protein